ncbi:hypothetical protein NG895_21015 [Aeoliella sp. ICT_H6.2]|uniref:PEP-CTERM sorting domain-containing protein n=1 Tax=Aeoliella straminimaris TaxID=2954799 RepID=A0A9X2FE61_9BACT|nr:hypothetical protein [Aeoliella straminimaris]MCO6046387.1 hypothetical protein [Aeoliella straminimaris]
MCRTQMMLATYAVIAIFAATANAQTLLFDFEDGTDQGFGAKFSSDVSETFPIISMGDSNRMEVLRNGDFQKADRGSGGDAPDSLSPLIYRLD